MTKEMYIQIYRKIWATIRHDMWKSINAEKKKLKVNKLEEKEFFGVYEKEHENFEKVRLEIYELMMDETDVTQFLAKEVMQKAYINFATIPQAGLDQEGGEAVRSRWADLVNETSKQHSRYVSDFSRGVFYDNIEKDPRDSKAPDEKVDISSV